MSLLDCNTNLNITNVIEYKIKEYIANEYIKYGGALCATYDTWSYKFHNEYLLECNDSKNIGFCIDVNFSEKLFEISYEIINDIHRFEFDENGNKLNINDILIRY